MKKRFLVFLCCLAIQFVVQAQNYKTHKVRSGETIEAIAKQYLVTPFDIYALNPDAKGELRPEMVLIIPANSKVVNSDETEKTKELIGYKTHKVKRKETLYSISKTYNVEIDEIKKYNTYLYSENLRKGDKIKIPRYKTIVSKVSLNNTIKKYKVLPSEGKWRVAYKFGITVSELEDLNPNMTDSLKVGQELNVPNIADNLELSVDDSYNYYEVQPAEGFYSIEKKLGVTQEEIEALNPEVKSNGLKLGMVIKVPKKESNVIDEVRGDSTISDLTGAISDYNTKKVALMLPYRLNRIDVDSIAEAKDQIREDRLLSISLDFYSGVRFALDSAKQVGISTDLKVLDTENNLSEVSRLLQNSNLSDYDAVIGPLMPDNFERVASRLKGSGVPVVSPLTQPQNVYSNVLQTIPNASLLTKSMIEFVKNNSEGMSILIISDSKSKSRSAMLKSNFPDAKQMYSNLNKEGNDSYYLMVDDLIEVLVEGDNLVFLESKNEAFVSNVTSMLNGLITEDIKITLATTDKNRAFEGKNISNHHLSNLFFHYPSANKSFDYEAKNGFIEKYIETYGVAPNKYAIRGFDVTLDILLRMANEDFNSNWSLDGKESEYLENKFRYTKKAFGGYINDAVYIVKYDNLSIVEVKSE
ncbi:MAG: hypothetical protein BM564_00195 [Bacteroidetes bacterium MedPE-SWsnd-G2]|nr:MAG: hypothetical protein BM564_00195 [Bacteroidetes bacterium MedPE-SWsnd-G2]